MLTYRKLFNKPRKLIRFTGLTQTQYTTLTARLLPLWNEAEECRLLAYERIKAIGQGRKYKLTTIEDKLLVILVLYRTYTNHELLGWIFNLDGSNITRLITKLTPLIEQAADPELLTMLESTQKRRKKISTWEEFVKEYPDLAEIITDATEQERERPNKRKQKAYYSGKKKQHTLKTQVSVSKRGRIVNVSKTYPGSIHDKKVLDEEKTVETIPKETKQFLDRGYDGIDTKYPTHDIRLPYKRRRNKQKLKRGEKLANTIRSKHRIIVEHVLSKLKKYQILKQVYRSSEDQYNQHFRNIAALVNFRLLTVP